MKTKPVKYLLATLTTAALSAQALTPAEFTQSVIDDMQGPNAGAQIGLDRGQYAVTQMGLLARGDNTPTYWVPTGPLATQLKSQIWWTAITPWWNMLPLAGNAAVNVQLEVGTIATIGRKKGTQTWYTVFSSETGWVGLYDPNGTVSRGTPVEKSVITASGYKSKIYNWVGGSAGDNTLHGGSGVFPIDAQSLDGVINCIAARVVGPDAAKAKFGMWAGMDWYYNTAYRYGQNGNGPPWGPAISASRIDKIGTDWTVTCTAPLNPPGRGADAVNYTAGTAGVYMSATDLKANPVAEPAGLLPAGTVTPPPVEPPPVEPPPETCTTCPAGPPGPIGPPGPAGPAGPTGPAGTLTPCLSTAIPAGISWHTVIAMAHTGLAECGR